MEYQKIRNLLDDTTNLPSTFRTTNWVEINYESRGTYNASNQIEFKTSVIGQIYVTATGLEPTTT